MRCKVWMVFLAMVIGTSTQAAEIDFSSALDFTKTELVLKDIDSPNPEIVVLSVTLSPRPRSVCARSVRNRSDSR